MSRLMIFYISSEVKIQNISSTPQCAFGSQFSQHPGREVTILLGSITVEAWLDLEYNGIILGELFCVWLVFLNIISLRIIHVFECGNSLFLLYSIPLYDIPNVLQFIYLFYC